MAQPEPGTFVRWLCHVRRPRAARPALRDAARRLVIARAEEQLAVNRYVEARALARRALALDPYSDAALSLAMRSAALEGDPASGVALYQEFAERLQRDLGGRPSPQLTGLATRIRENRWQRPRGRHPDREPPLIGRRDSHARLFAELERVPREGSACLVISGEPGADGREIFFNSRRLGSILNPGGQPSFDLWVATRRNLHDAWSTPVNLGAPVNSPVAEFHPNVSHDGRTLLFIDPSSAVRGGFGGFDIWMSTRTVNGKEES